MKVFGAFLLFLVAASSHGQGTNFIYPSQQFTASAQTGATIQLNGQSTTSTVASSYSAGTVTLTGTNLTTVTLSIQGSSDNGVSFYPLPISTVASPGTTPTLTVTATLNGIYQVNLLGVTHIRFVTSGTFTATSVNLTLIASPNGNLSRNSGSGSGTQVGACVGTFAASMTAGTLQAMGAGSSGACSGTLTGNGNVMGQGGGVLKNLSVRCITPGVNASSGLFTLMDAPPGTAFASAVSTGLTVTFGTHAANTAVFDNTHTFPYSKGDLIFIQITTQASETLATCSASYNF